MLRVLIDEFDAIVRLGLADLFAEAGCEVGEGIAELDIERSRPDVVLVDLDRPGRDARARQLSVDHPSMTVIALASDALTMRVFPPFHRGESYRASLSPAQLLRAATGMEHG